MGIQGHTLRACQFCGVHESLSNARWFYVCLKWDRRVQVLLYWQSEGSQQKTLCISPLTVKKPVRHCQFCVMKANPCDLILVAVNGKLFKYIVSSNIWLTVAGPECQYKSCVGHLAAAGPREINTYWFSHVVISKANQILLLWNDQENKPNPFPLTTMCRMNGAFFSLIFAQTKAGNLAG